jgi:hypothetical protein
LLFPEKYPDDNAPDFAMTVQYCTLEESEETVGMHPYSLSFALFDFRSSVAGPVSSGRQGEFCDVGHTTMYWRSLSVPKQDKAQIEKES